MFVCIIILCYILKKISLSLYISLLAGASCRRLWVYRPLSDSSKRESIRRCVACFYLRCDVVTCYLVEQFTNINIVLTARPETVLVILLQIMFKHKQ